MCVHVHVARHEKSGQGLGEGLLKRRVVFELTEDQLPALAAAEGRHGTKRAALLAALEAEASVVELAERAEKAEAALLKAERATTAAATKGGKATEKLRRELAAAKERLGESQADQAQARHQATASAKDLQAELEDLRDTLDERNVEVADLRERAVDWLFCGRCENWAPPSEWSWQRTEAGGSYAYHRPCGDHGPGLLGSSSRLAQHRR